MEAIAGTINSVDTATTLKSSLFFMKFSPFDSEERKDIRSRVFTDLFHRPWTQNLPAIAGAKLNSFQAMWALQDWGAERPTYAVLVPPLRKCKIRSTMPTMNKRWTKPALTWNARNPNNQRTIKTKAINPSMFMPPSLPSGTIKLAHVAERADDRGEIKPHAA
jgi:hypothetical protein